MNTQYQILDKKNEPIISVDYVKNYLRISHDYDDELIETLIFAAIECIESFTGLSIQKSKIECLIERAPQYLYLKHVPFMNILSINKIIDNKPYDISKNFGRANTEKSLILFNTEHQNSKITMQYECGYGLTTPHIIKAAILKHISLMYELNDDTLDPLEEIRSLLIPYRRIKI